MKAKTIKKEPKIRYPWDGRKFSPAFNKEMKETYSNLSDKEQHLIDVLMMYAEDKVKDSRRYSNF